MTHLTINPWFLEFNLIDVKTPALNIPQLAGMAHGANCLVAGRGIELLPRTRVSALASWAVNHLPEINPLPVQHVVLNREDVDFTIGKSCGISLLKFRSYG